MRAIENEPLASFNPRTTWRLLQMRRNRRQQDVRYQADGEPMLANIGTTQHFSLEVSLVSNSLSINVLNSYPSLLPILNKV